MHAQERVRGGPIGAKGRVQRRARERPWLGLRRDLLGVQVRPWVGRKLRLSRSQAWSGLGAGTTWFGQGADLGVSRGRCERGWAARGCGRAACKRGSRGAGLRSGRRASTGMGLGAAHECGRAVRVVWPWASWARCGRSTSEVGLVRCGGAAHGHREVSARAH